MSKESRHPTERNIYVRSSGDFVVRWMIGTGDRRRKVFKTLAQARRFRDKNVPETGRETFAKGGRLLSQEQRRIAEENRKIIRRSPRTYELVDGKRFKVVRLPDALPDESSVSRARMPESVMSAVEFHWRNT